MKGSHHGPGQSPRERRLSGAFVLLFLARRPRRERMAGGYSNHGCLQVIQS